MKGDITNEDILGSRQLSGRVGRWHTWPMIRRPTTAEHQCRVATLYIDLWGLPRAEVLEYCLKHDAGELTAGDTPFAAKHKVPELGRGVNEAERIGLGNLRWELPQLTPQEFRRFKIADILEMYETAVVECRMGNRYARPCVESCISAVMPLAREIDQPALLRIVDWLKENPND